MAGSSDVRLRLSSRPENVVLVRQALGGVAGCVGLDALELNDITTAVSEACNNVALHAYGGAEGPLEIEISSRPAAFHVVVRDHGRGIDPGQVNADARSIGLPIIRALAESVEYAHTRGGGTEVRIAFSGASANGGALGHPGIDDGLRLQDVPVLGQIAEHEPPDTVTMAIGPAPLNRAVLPRVVTTLAARAHFSTDRIPALELIAGTLARGVEGALEAPYVSVTLRVAVRELELQIGPLRAGRAAAVLRELRTDHVGREFEALTAGHTVSRAGDSELLALRFAQAL